MCDEFVALTAGVPGPGPRAGPVGALRWCIEMGEPV